MSQRAATIPAIEAFNPYQVYELAIRWLVRGMRGQAPGWHQWYGCFVVWKCEGIRMPEEDQEPNRC
eukprot:365287-Chlamydomonas_euryale.AAC.6